MAHINAEREAANPADNARITKLFQTIECADATASQILTPHNAPIRDPRRIRAMAAVTAMRAP
jgi:hypothetical protein